MYNCENKEKISKDMKRKEINNKYANRRSNCIRRIAYYQVFKQIISLNLISQDFSLLKRKRFKQLEKFEISLKFIYVENRNSNPL